MTATTTRYTEADVQQIDPRDMRIGDLICDPEADGYSARRVTRRKAADWKTAREITDRLARLDPHDPVRYDYALCELGTIGICRPSLAASLCVECPLNAACPAGRRRVMRAA